MADPADFTIRDQTGRTVLVTGANSGLGFQTASRLAQAGATVLLGCRNPDKADVALRHIRENAPGASAHIVSVDLASLDSIRDAADRVHEHHDSLDLLINNAGVMAIPRRETADGFEMQFGTNHLGHFALTGLLIDLLVGVEGSRIVNVSSNAHKSGRLNFDDLMGEQRYGKWRAYGQSKLANLAFTYELQRRLESSGASTIALAAHPGWAVTNLQTSGRGVTGGPMLALTKLANAVMGQSDEMGSLPTLEAATSPDAVAGDYYGPKGIGEMRGMPTKVSSNGRSHDQEAQRRLWEISVELTGVDFGALDEQ